MTSTGGLAPRSGEGSPHLSCRYMKRVAGDMATKDDGIHQCFAQGLAKNADDGCDDERDSPVAWCGVALWNTPSSVQDCAEEHRGSPPCQVRCDIKDGKTNQFDAGTSVDEHDEHGGVHPEDGGRSPEEKTTVRTAWLSAAMAWRQKNMPSASELKKRRAEVSQRISEAARKRNSACNNTTSRRMGRDTRQPHVQPTVEHKPLVMPTDCASEAEWKAYFRMHHTLRIERATSFVQVLRAFNIPCSDPKKIKMAYMQAVRMYHPDSNSKARKWSSARGKAEAEEIMKLINSRKPDSLCNF